MMLAHCAIVNYVHCKSKSTELVGEYCIAGSVWKEQFLEIKLKTGFQK